MMEMSFGFYNKWRQMVRAIIQRPAHQFSHKPFHRFPSERSPFYDFVRPELIVLSHIEASPQANPMMRPPVNNAEAITIKQSQNNNIASPFHGLVNLPGPIENIFYPSAGDTEKHPACPNLHKDMFLWVTPFDAHRLTFPQINDLQPNVPPGSSYPI